MILENKPRVAIIDYGMGNLFSVQRALEHVSLGSVITSDKSEIASSDAAILPGVGAFGDAMDNLKRLDLVTAIKDFIDTGKPFMGICLGMQLLMGESHEFGLHKGLGIIGGSVVKFPTSDINGRRSKVPQVNWNQIFAPDSCGRDYWKGSFLENIADGEFMYFVHSYYAIPENDEVVLSVTNYGGVEYCSSIHYRNIFATQFHPEKSGREGLKIYGNWSLLVRRFTRDREDA